jgi:DNA-binding response OmpR family regulator
MASLPRRDLHEIRPGALPASIMVVDDTPADIASLLAILSEAGYRVRAAPDGDTAFEQSRVTSPDLILLDTQMPGMNGFETCRRLRQLPKLSETPVIFMTTPAESEDRISVFAAGGDDYVTRPFQYQEVLARVRLHLSHSSLAYELEHLHREFEKRVAARTVELKTAVAEGEALRSLLQQENRALKEQLRKSSRPK